MDSKFGETKRADQILSPEVISQHAFAQWCKAFGVENRELPAGTPLHEKVIAYGNVFSEGLEQLKRKFLEQAQGFNIERAKQELAALRATTNSAQKISDKEIEIVREIQTLISSYDYESSGHNPVEILAKREMNCVGATMIGGALLDELGIRFAYAGAGAHVFLVVATSSWRVLWQDMQDGKEKPGLDNGDIHDALIIDGERTRDILAFIQYKDKQSVTFTVNKPGWEDKPVTLESFEPAARLSMLINVGFELPEKGMAREAVEILRIAEYEAPHNADVHIGLAKAFRKLGAYSEAIDELKKALKIDPEYKYAEDMIKELTQ